MNSIHLPLVFAPEQTAVLHREQTLLAEALEKHGALDAEHLARLRAALTEALDSQPARVSLIERLRDDARVRQHTLHLTLADANDTLLNLPWHVVAEDCPNLLISKGLPLRGRTDLDVFTPDLPLPLKVLVMVAAPDHSGGGRLDYEAEEKIILDALAPLMRSGEVEVDFTDDGSLDSLRRALAANRYHVLHFSGHSSFGARNIGETPEATLLLEAAFSMQASPTPAADFADALNAGQPALVLLSSCQSAQGGTEGGFRGVAHRLMQAGIPAVIAMGWSVADFWATQFAGAFFQALAKREPLGRAFNLALESGRQPTAPGIPPAYFQSQSLIPQLFLTQQVDKLVVWQGAPEKRLSRASSGLLEGKSRLGAKLKKVNAVFGRADKDLLFIGRRRERKAALAALRDGRSVLLRGQGGMGKTALALHLAMRQLVANPDGCVPLAFDQTTLSLENVCSALLDYLEVDVRLRTMRLQVAALDKQWDKFFLLLEHVEKQQITPFFIFDNLESFQPADDPGGALDPGTLELLDYMLTRLGYPVLCTGRYPLQEFDADVLHIVDLNEAPAGDFRQKCLHLPALPLLQVPGRLFDDIAATLHRSLGGNYRALEFFDELCRNAPAAAPATLEELDTLLAGRTGETLHHIAGDLVFDRLVALLTPDEQRALLLLAQFRRPVLPFAVAWQDKNLPDPEVLLNRAADLTLAERRTGEAADRIYYFVPPLVQELLDRENLHRPDFDDMQAGAYYEKVDADLNEQNYFDLEEAFFHYERVGNVEKVNETGNKLSGFYYDRQQFQRSFDFARRTENTAGAQTSGLVLNTLGILFQLSGKLDAALHFLQRSLADSQQRSDRQGEGMTLNNISQIYDSKGDYDTTLGYLHQSLKIQQEIGDRKGEGVTLNNLASTAHGKGDYDTALGYLQQSLKIMQEIGDREGEGTTLNNISQIYDAKGDYDTALGYLQQSLKIRQEIGDRKGEGATLGNIGKIHFTKGDYDTALGYWQQSLKITQEIGDINGMAITLTNMGILLFKQNRLEEAVPLLLQAYQIFKQIGSPNSQVSESYLDAIIEEIGEDRFRALVQERESSG